MTPVYFFFVLSNHGHRTASGIQVLFRMHDPLSNGSWRVSLPVSGKIGCNEAALTAYHVAGGAAAVWQRIKYVLGQHRPVENSLRFHLEERAGISLRP